jgi:hypothetical protein
MRHDPVDFRAGFRFSAGEGDAGVEEEGGNGEVDAPPTTEQEVKHAAEGLVESNKHTHVAAEQAENEGENDGANADPATVTREVAENAGNMVTKAENAIKQLTMGLQALQVLQPQLAYVKGLAETVAESTPEPPPHVEEGTPGYNGRRFGARQPSLLRRLNQQSTYAAPQRYRLQSRGLARR